jgi:hypothetical protein
MTQTMPHPRFGVLTLAPQERHQRYVIVDCHTGGIVDGVYHLRDVALRAAAYLEELGEPIEDMVPNAEALDLLFPARTREGT